MIKIIYLYKQNAMLNSFLGRQIRETLLEGTLFSSYSLENRPDLADKYNIYKYHTVIFEDLKGNEISRIEDPFSSQDIEDSIKEAKQFIVGQL